MAKRKTQIQHAEIVVRFSARLRELRHSRGMTQANLARKARVTATYIGRLESAGAAPGIDLVKRIADALGVPVTELFPTEEVPDSTVVLKAQSKELFESLLKAADRETLFMLNPLLARLLESSNRMT